MQLSSRANRQYDIFSSIPCSPERTVAVLLLLAPHPSILHVLLNYHYLTLRAPLYFVAHLLIIYTFSFLAFSSLIACVARDPGPVPEAKSEDPHDLGGSSGAGAGGGGDEISIEDALLSTAPSSDDYSQPGRWCRICWKPKPERAHHCSQCGRCVLKMGACDVSPHLPVSVLFITARPYSHFPFRTRNITVRSPLSLVGCKMYRALFAIIELINRPAAAPVGGTFSRCAWETERCPAGLPDVPLVPSLPCIRYVPGSLRFCGVHPRARFCV
jgi:DHHC palmitoyltransferase